MKAIQFILCMLLASLAWSQEEISGQVADQSENDLIGVTVLLKNDRTTYTFTDETGNFSLPVSSTNKNDTLQFRYTGMHVLEIPVAKALEQKQFLLKNQGELDDVIIIARRAISEEFSVKKQEPMDIYFNPMAKGDPLNAVQMLPASTDTEESASPSLRGSQPNRSIVVVEGVPVRNPVRYNQLNATGNFSIFNTQLLKEQWIYASNPPIVHGNSTAGLIEIELKEKAERDGWDVNLGLAQIGGSFTKSFKNNGFATVYGNHGYSSIYKAVNGNNIASLNDFSNTDLGVRLFNKIGKNASHSLLNYSAIEDYDVNFSLFAHRDNAIAKQKRNFTISKLQWGSDANNFSLNNGLDVTDSEFTYGNMESNVKRNDVFTGLNYRKNNSKSAMQFGLSHRYSKDNFKEKQPLYYYALSKDAPNVQADTLLQNSGVEAYAYGKLYAGIFTISGGLRQSLLTRNSDETLSYQAAIRANLDSRHSLLLSAGKYHNYNYPSSNERNVNLLESNQIALDYQYLTDKRDIVFAAFLKEENNDLAFANEYVSSNQGIRKIKGLEISWSEDIAERWKLDLANTFLDVQVEEGNIAYRAANDFNYLLKAGLTYFNNDIFSFGTSLLARPGTHYTAIESGYYNPAADAFAPIFPQTINNTSYGNYTNWSFTANRMFKLSDTKSLIAYGVVNNLLNRDNESSAIYVPDYSSNTFDNYSKRWAYTGVMFQF